MNALNAINIHCLFRWSGHLQIFQYPWFYNLLQTNWNKLWIPNVALLSNVSSSQSVHTSHFLVSLGCKTLSFHFHEYSFKMDPYCRTYCDRNHTVYTYETFSSLLGVKFRVPVQFFPTIDFLFLCWSQKPANILYIWIFIFRFRLRSFRFNDVRCETYLYFS